MSFVTYNTLTIAYEGFIFDYTVDMGGSVQIYHEKGELKDFIGSVALSCELDGIDALKGFAVGWYTSNVDEDKVKCIYTEDGKLTITVGGALKFQQECLVIDKYDTHHEILVYRIGSDGEKTYLDSIPTADKVDRDTMLLLIDDWSEGN